MIANDPAFSKWLVDVRRDIHLHPEISYQERRTTEKIKSILGELGIEVHGFSDMNGAVGLFKGAGPGKTIALRADIDALPIQELNDTPYRSTNDGVMHACGHDANLTIMLGVAKRMVESGMASAIHGNVKFLFQPAEERGAGAKAMIAHGALENPGVDRVVACHMSPDLPVGKMGVFRNKGYAASDRFYLQIKGKGAHGGRPEESIDPIVAGAYFVAGIQSIVGRNIKPTDAAVITVGRFVAGDVANVIPETAFLEGTIRTLSGGVRDQVLKRLREAVEGLEKAYGVVCKFELHEGVPSCVNDEEVATFLYETSAQVLGPDNVQYLPPIMGAEDFAYFALERPSAIVRLGCSNPERRILSPLHSPRFDIDERVLEIGVRIFYRAVKSYLTSGLA